MQTSLKWILLSWLFVDRIVYTLNWLAISAAQPFIAEEFGITLTSLGFLGTVFLIGIGASQIPAAILANKFGPRKIALTGLLSSSVFAGLCGFAPNFETLVVLRFLTGISLSFFFGPGITFFTPLFTTRERGTALGIYNAGFHAGTLLALGLWPTVTTTLGWRTALLIPGVLGVFLTAATYQASRDVKDQVENGSFGLAAAKSTVVLASAFGLGLAGAAWYPLTQFGILYLNAEADLAIEYAGVLISVLSVGSVIGAPVAGKLYDRSGDRKRLLYLFNGLSGFSLAAFVFTPVLLVPLTMFFIGLLYTASNSMFYLAPISVLQQRDIAVAVAVVNSVHLLAASIIPFAFSNIVEAFGYFYGWISMALLCLLALVCIAKLSF